MWNPDAATSSSSSSSAPADPEEEEEEEEAKQSQGDAEWTYNAFDVQATFVFSANLTKMERFRHDQAAQQYFQKWFRSLPAHADLVHRWNPDQFDTIFQDARRLLYKWTFDGVAHLVSEIGHVEHESIRPSMDIIQQHRDYAFSEDRFAEYSVQTIRELFNAYITEINMVAELVKLFDHRANAANLRTFASLRIPLFDHKPIHSTIMRIQCLVLNYYLISMQQYYMFDKLHCHRSWTMDQLQSPDQFPNQLLNIQMMIPEDDAGGGGGDKKPRMDRKVKIILWLLNRFQMEQYAYIGDTIYLPRLHDGIHTRSWKRYKPIADVVWELAQKDSHAEMWSVLVSSGKDIVPELAQKLISMNDWQFPRVNKHRNLFAFRNGIYITNIYDVFGTEPPVDPETGNRVYADKFFFYHELPGIDPSYAAAKYFDQDFVPFTDEQEQGWGEWYTLPTPAFQSILDFQFQHIGDECEDVCRMMYVMIGRLLHEAGHMDNWQVWPYLKGCAGTGKSTIITRVCKEFFAPEDVGILASTSEKMFGVSAFIDKKLVIAPEMGKACDFPQTTLQSMISAEDVNCAQKFKTAEMKKFTVPGICAGNENMGGSTYRDVGGSLARRWIWFLFENKIPQRHLDMSLPQKLLDELPAIMLKCNHAYIQYVNKYQKEDIFRSCPSYFRQRREEFASDSSPLVKFLQSDHVVRDNDAYIPMNKFKQLFASYCQTVLLMATSAIPQIEIESMQTALADMKDNDGIQYRYERTKKRLDYPRHSPDSVSCLDFFVIGVDINEEQCIVGMR